MVRLPPGLRPLFPYIKPAYTKATRAVAPLSRRLSTLRGGYLPTTATTLERAGRDGRYCLVRQAQEVRRPIPRGLPPADRAFVDEARELELAVAVAEIPGGRMLGPHHAVVTGRGELVHDVCFYFGTTRPSEHPLFLHPFPGPPLEVEGRLGVLASRGATNYYHYLFDVVARLDIIEQCVQMETPERWYVPARTGFQRQFLSMLGIGPDQRVDSTQFPHVRAGTLVVPSVPAITGRRPAWAVAFLRRRLLPSGLRLVPGRFLYVTRSNSGNNRSVVNEQELIATLEARGFDTVDPGSMSVTQQIRAFAEAEVIVAPHGAALANLVFANAGACVIELFPAAGALPDFWKVASGVPGLEYRYLIGLGEARGGRRQVLVQDIAVDLDALCSILDDTAAGFA